MQTLSLKQSSWPKTFFGPMIVIGMGTLLLPDWEGVWVEKAVPKTGKVIAHITLADQEVKVKPSDGVAWNKVAVSDSLIAQDSVYTGDGASATILFDDKTSIEMGERSLVLIEKNESGPASLTVVRGNVDARVQSPTANLNLKVKGAQPVLSLKEGHAQIQVAHGEESDIRVLAGRLEVKRNGKSDTVPMAAGVKIGRDGAVGAATVMVATLVSPNSTARFFEKTAIELTWKRASDKGGPLQVEVAQDRAFARQKQVFKTSDNSLKLPYLPAGSWYWRVTGSDSSVGPSDIRTFAIAQVPQVRLLSPADHSAVSFRSDAQQADTAIAFDWSVHKDIATYNIQVSPVSGGDGITMPSVKPPLLLKGLSPGKYRWYVSAAGTSGVDFGKTATREFEVRSFTVPPVPELLSPNSDAEFLPRSDGAVVTSTWKTSGATVSYLLDVAEQADFKKAVTQKIQARTLVGANHWQGQWSPPGYGSYYWRLTSLDDLGQRSSPSGTRRLVVKMAPARLTMPVAGSLVAAANKQQTFNWEPVWRADSYFIEVSADRDFKVIEFSQKVTKPSAQITLKAGQNYFWRVTSTSGPEKTLSQIQAFTIAPEAPIIAPPKLKGSQNLEIKTLRR